MTNSDNYLCKKCKLKEKYYVNYNKNNIDNKDYNEDNIIIVLEDFPENNRLIPDVSVTIFSILCLTTLYFKYYL
jgi:hypothetical protein